MNRLVERAAKVGRLEAELAAEQKHKAVEIRLAVLEADAQNGRCGRPWRPWLCVCWLRIGAAAMSPGVYRRTMAPRWSAPSSPLIQSTLPAGRYDRPSLLLPGVFLPGLLVLPLVLELVTVSCDAAVKSWISG